MRFINLNTETLLLMAFFLICSFNIAILLQQPNQNDWFLIDELKELQFDTNFPIYNDWSYGHWLRIKGIETIYRSGGNNPRYLELEKPFIAFTDQNLDCNLVEKKIYVCN